MISELDVTIRYVTLFYKSKLVFIMKSKETKVKAVVFDCFGVVFKNRYKDFLNENQKALEQYIETTIIPTELIDTPEKWGYPEYFNYLSYKIDLKLIVNEEYYNIFSQASNRSVNEIKKQLRDVSCINKEMVSCITDLKILEYKTALIANADRDFLEQFIQTLCSDLKYSTIAELFDVIRTSSQIGSGEKKSAEMIDTVIKELGVSIDEILIIDDSAVGVEEFQQLGVEAIQFTGSIQDIYNSLLD